MFCDSEWAMITCIRSISFRMHSKNFLLAEAYKLDANFSIIHENCFLRVFLVIFFFSIPLNRISCLFFYNIEQTIL